MKYVALIIAIAGGFGLGWLVRDRTVDEPTARNDGDRTAIAVRERKHRAEVERLVERAKTSEAEVKRLSTRVEELVQAEAAKEPAADDAALTGIGKEKFDQVIKGMAAQWRGMATVAAKRDLKALLDELGFDAETAKKIEAAVEKDVDRAMEQTAYAMFGEGEMDPNAFLYFMGLPGELSKSLEAELATFLDDGAIGDVRSGFKAQSKEAMTRMANAQISMMAIPDLSDDQQTRIREIFADTNIWESQMRKFAEVTKDKKKFAALMSGEVDLEADLRSNMEPQREQMRSILTPEQFTRYEKYETQQVAQQQMGIKWMQAMFSSKSSK